MKKIESYLDRIADESNWWLKALQAEDECNYLQAFLFYLKDATKWIRENYFARAALSCSCAAGCLTHTGNLDAARQLHLQTAELYEKNADKTMVYSVREALWSSQEAYMYFVLAGQTNKANEVYERFLSLSRKTNPFSGEKEALELMKARKIEAESFSDTHQTNMEISADIDNAIKNFLDEIRPRNEKMEESIFQRIYHKFSKEKNTSEKNIDA